MTASGEGQVPKAAGGPARHVPVLLAEAISALAPKAGGLYLDATFGAGGYSRALLQSHPDLRVLAIDRDPDAIKAGAALASEFPNRLTLIQGRFGDLERIVASAGFETLDGIVLDIGVSSMQLDEAARGFSFRLAGPLDMRMAKEGPTAADLVNTASESEIADILFAFGEERKARLIARRIVAERKREPILTTERLATIVEAVSPPRFGQIHPATRVFQALRIAVNDELAELTRALAASEARLKAGGRLAVVTFHSLEDRIVKSFLTERSGKGKAGSRLLPGETAPEPATFTLITRKPIEPSQAEIAANPRSRSAKLRVAERSSAPARTISTPGKQP